MTSYDRRREAAERVRGMYPPLTEIFASLRASAGVAVEPAPPVDPAPPVEVEPPVELAPPVEPAPPAEPDDPLDAALLAAGREATGDPDDIVLALALAIEDTVVHAVRAGASTARAAGVPGDWHVSITRAMDAALPILTPYANAIAAGTVEPPEGLARRIRAVAESAGVVEAVWGTPWSAVQRFGDPFCPRGACYGRNGSLLTDERIAVEGFPPFGDGCNCSAVAADLP